MTAVAPSHYDYMPKGTGSDETTALQAVINAKSHVSIGPGVCYVQALSIPSNVLIELNNTTLRLVANSISDVVKTSTFDTLFAANTSTAGNVQWGLIGKGVIDGNKANAASGGRGFCVYGQHYRIGDLEIINTHGVGLVTAGKLPGSGADECEPQIERLRIWNCDGDGWDHWGPSDVQAGRVVIADCSGTNGYWSQANGHGVQINSMHIWGIGNTYGSRFDADTQMVQNLEVEGSTNLLWIRSVDNNIGNCHLFQPAPAAKKGIIIGDTGVKSGSGNITNFFVENCSSGGIEFRNSSGNGRFTGRIYDSTGSTQIIFTEAENPYDHHDIQVYGHSDTGARSLIHFPSGVTINADSYSPSIISREALLDDVVSFSTPRWLIDAIPTNTFTPSSGVAYLAAIPVKKGQVINKVGFSTQAGTWTLKSDAHWWVALWDSATHLQYQSADQTTTALATLTNYLLSLTGTYTAPADDYVYAGVMVNVGSSGGAGTAGTLLGYTGAIDTPAKAMFANEGRLHGTTGSGLTTTAPAGTFTVALTNKQAVFLGASA